MIHVWILTVIFHFEPGRTSLSHNETVQTYTYVTKDECIDNGKFFKANYNDSNRSVRTFCNQAYITK